MLPLELRSCNLDHEHVAHSHDHHQLILATSGVTELALEGRGGGQVTSRRGCLIPCSRAHEYQGDGSNCTLVLDIPVTRLTLLDKDAGIERLFDTPRFFNVPPGLNQLAHSLAYQLEQCPALQNEIAMLLLRALEVYLQGSPAGSQPTGIGCVTQRLDMGRLNAWLDQHLADEVRVEQLAGLCALSLGHFHVCFRDMVGMTPLAYVQRRRLEHARTLVQQRSLSLGHVAALVGFRDQGSFSRAYRRYFDVSPSRDRQSPLVI
ncbi:AraC family transcriptional regulator [Halomonas sediminis]